MNNKGSIVIVGMARTPMGGFQGVLKDVTAPVLGSFAIRAALERSGVEAEDIDEVLDGLRTACRNGTGPGASSLYRGRNSICNRLHHCEQDVWFRNENYNAGT